MVLFGMSDDVPLPQDVPLPVPSSDPASVPVSTPPVFSDHCPEDIEREGNPFPLSSRTTSCSSLEATPRVKPKKARKASLGTGPNTPCSVHCPKLVYDDLDPSALAQVTRCTSELAAVLEQLDSLLLPVDVRSNKATLVCQLKPVRARIAARRLGL